MKEIPRPCNTCRVLTTNKSGYCDKHEPAYLELKAKRDAMYNIRRGSPSKRGYDASWVKCRNLYLELHPLCENCEKQGRITPAKEVHHIIALADGGARLDFDNLMAVCRPCHKKLTLQEYEKRKNSN